MKQKIIQCVCRDCFGHDFEIYDMEETPEGKLTGVMMIVCSECKQQYYFTVKKIEPELAAFGLFWKEVEGELNLNNVRSIIKYQVKEKLKSQ